MEISKRVIRVLLAIILIGMSASTNPTFAQTNSSIDLCSAPHVGDVSSLLSRKCKSSLNAVLALETASVTPKVEPKPSAQPQVVPQTPIITWVAQEPSTPAATLNPDIIFNLINQYRQSLNLAPFQKDPAVCGVAQARLPQLPSEAVTGNLHHGLYAMNLPYWVTENMKYGGNEAEAVNWWLHSPIHHAAIVSNVKYSCGVCNGNICVQEFTSYVPK